MIDEFLDRQATNDDLFELEDVETGEKKQYRIVSKATVTQAGTNLNKATFDPILEEIRGKLSTSGGTMQGSIKPNPAALMNLGDVAAYWNNVYGAHGLFRDELKLGSHDVWHKGELKIATGSTSLTPPNRTGTNNSEISTTISLSPWGFTETPKVFVTGLTGSPLNMMTSATVSGSGPWNLIIKLTFVSNDPNAQPWGVGIQWMAIGK